MFFDTETWIHVGLGLFSYNNKFVMACFIAYQLIELVFLGENPADTAQDLIEFLVGGILGKVLVLPSV